MREITVQDEQNAGWTVRFVDKADFEQFKEQSAEKFGRHALRAKKLRQSWPQSKVFDGALAYENGKVIHFELKGLDLGKWLERRNLRFVRL